jgi:hypothetical protein
LSSPGEKRGVTFMLSNGDNQQVYNVDRITRIVLSYQSLYSGILFINFLAGGMNHGLRNQ